MSDNTHGQLKGDKTSGDRRKILARIERQVEETHRLMHESVRVTGRNMQKLLNRIREELRQEVRNLQTHFGQQLGTLREGLDTLTARLDAVSPEAAKEDAGMAESLHRNEVERASVRLACEDQDAWQVSDPRWEALRQDIHALHQTVGLLPDRIGSTEETRADAIQAIEQLTRATQEQFAEFREVVKDLATLLGGQQAWLERSGSLLTALGPALTLASPARTANHEHLLRELDASRAENQQLQERLQQLLQRFALQGKEALYSSTIGDRPSHARLVEDFQRVERRFETLALEAFRALTQAPDTKLGRSSSQQVARIKAVLSRHLLLRPWADLRAAPPHPWAEIESVHSAILDELVRLREVSSSASVSPLKEDNLRQAIEESRSLLQQMTMAVPPGLLVAGNESTPFDTNCFEPVRGCPEGKDGAIRVMFTVFPGYCVHGSSKVNVKALVYTEGVDWDHLPQDDE